MQYKFNGANTFAEVFTKMITIINLVAMARFFEMACYGIFEYLLATSSKDKRLLSPISTYFGIVKRNSWGILYLNYLVWLCGAFHITLLYKRLQADFEYTACIVEFIDCIFRCSIIPEDEVYVPQSNVSSASFDNSNSSFVLKLDINSNAVARKC